MHMTKTCMLGFLILGVLGGGPGFVPGPPGLIPNTAQAQKPEETPAPEESPPPMISAEQIKAWSAEFRDWHYYPEFVLPPSPDDGLDFVSIDCPLVFEHEGEWRMFYTGFDGNGYQTALAVSDDLVHWEPRKLVMSYGKEGAYDHGGVTFGGLLFEDYHPKAPRTLKRWEGKYWALYGCYPRQGGYELRPGAEGLAWSEDGNTWHRHSEDTPILSIEGAEAWEEDCIYQPWLIERDGIFWNFYNAAQGSIEQSGIAFSQDLVEWERYAENPVLRNGPPGSYDEQFCADPKVFHDGEKWTAIYFGVGRGGAHIMIAFSRDGLNWVKDPEPLYKAGGHPGGLDATYAHKISLIYQPDNETFYMYYCAVGDQGRGIGLLTSKPIETPEVDDALPDGEAVPDEDHEENGDSSSTMVAGGSE